MRSSPTLVSVLVLLALALGPVTGARAEQLEGSDEPSAPDTQAAATESPSMRQIRARLERLRDAATRETSVRTALEQADLALSRAELARAQANQARAQRAERLAEAATSLAERRLALVHERDAMRSTQARKVEAEQRADNARQALAVAQKHAAETP